MNEEVKKLLEDLKKKRDCDFIKITGDSINDLLKYINQLEEENKQVKANRGIWKHRHDITTRKNWNIKRRLNKTIKFCNYLLENDEVEIDGKKYYKHSCDDIITNAIIKRLNKYKGEHNEN